MGISGELWEILVYFKSKIIRLHNESTHITNRNKNEERLVNVMGGRVIETESERLMRQGMEQGMRQGVPLFLVWDRCGLKCKRQGSGIVIYNMQHDNLMPFME